MTLVFLSDIHPILIFKWIVFMNHHDEDHLCSCNNNQAKPDINNQLTNAVFNCDYERAVFLLDNGADVNSDLAYGSKLSHAVRNGDEKMLDLLLKHGADTKALDRHGYSLLICVTIDTPSSMAEAAIPLINKLIRHGADINQTDKYGTDLLTHAISKGNSVFFKYFLENGADLSHKNARGQTVFESAKMNDDMFKNYPEIPKFMDILAAYAPEASQKAQSEMSEVSYDKSKAPFVFSFDSGNETNDGETLANVYFFHLELTPEQEGLIGYADDDVLDAIGFFNFIEQNEEKYGVHDVSCSPPFFMGYTTYEVEPEKQDECFENIRNFFVEKGFNVSETEVFKDVYDDNVEEEYLNKHDIVIQSNSPSM